MSAVEKLLREIEEKLEKGDSVERKKQDFSDLYWSDPEKYGKNAGHIIIEDENGVLQCYDYTGTVYICTFKEKLRRDKKRHEAEVLRLQKLGFVF